jgi:hypothetical protein
MLTEGQELERAGGEARWGERGGMHGWECERSGAAAGPRYLTARGEGGSSGEVASGEGCSSWMTGMTLLVVRAGRPLSSTTEVTSWPSLPAAEAEER